MSTQCERCKSELAVEGISDGQRVRCVNCLHHFRYGTKAKLSADRLAWRSFWLGLASMIFLFLTGIPAIYYGIRSLLRMRFTKPRGSDRFAAVSGTAMGGCFGLFGGIVVVSLAVIIGSTFYTLERCEKPPEVIALYERHFESEVPEGLYPRRGLGVLKAQFFFDFNDQEKKADRLMRFHVAHFDSAFLPSKQQVMNDLKDKNLDSYFKLEKLESEQLTWKIVGQDTEITRTTFKIVEDRRKVNDDRPANVKLPEDAMVTQYHGIQRGSLQMTCMNATLVQPHPTFDEAKIKALFESIQPKTRE